MIWELSYTLRGGIYIEAFDCIREILAYYKTQIDFKDESELKFLYDKNMRNFDVIQTLLKNNYN
jgi:hypothetical protein